MIRGLSFVELTVADWAGALAWYRHTLGLGVVLEVAADQFALLQAGTCRLALKGGRPQPGTVLLTFEVQDLDAELRRLSGRGVVPEGPPKGSPEGYRRVHLRDPDGYRLSLFEWLVSSG